MKLRSFLAGVCLVVPALVVGACGSESSGGGGGGSVKGKTLTIYSSLPLQGTSREQSLAVINGEKLALDEVSSKVGDFKIKYVSLDDSTAQNPGTADEGQTQQNARKAIRDKTTIFYLGEFNSGGTKVSLPILNKGGIPQIPPRTRTSGSRRTSRARSPASRTSTTRRRSAPMPAWSRGTRSRAPRLPRS